MTKPLFVALALASALFVPLHVSAADEPGLAALRAEIEALKKTSETRITALEERLKAAEQGAKAMAAVPATAVGALRYGVRRSCGRRRSGGFGGICGVG